MGHPVYPSETTTPNRESFVSVNIFKKVGHNSQALPAVNIKIIRICHLGPSINDVSTGRGRRGIPNILKDVT